MQVQRLEPHSLEMDEKSVSHNFRAEWNATHAIKIDEL